MNYLPRDDTARATPEELQIVDSLFKNQTTRNAIYEELRPIVYAGICFALLSLPFTDMIIQSVLPIAQSKIVRIAIKTILFMFALYTIMLACDPTR